MSWVIMSLYDENPLVRFSIRDWIVEILLVISLMTLASFLLYTKMTMMMLIVTRVISIDMNSTVFTLDL